MNQNKKKITLQVPEIPFETVLNPGFLSMNDGNWKPVDLITNLQDEGETPTPIS